MSKLERWLTETQPNARQTLGLFRILYGLGYLWFMVARNNHDLWSQPSDEWDPIMILTRLSEPPSTFIFQLVLTGLIISLLFLIIGYKTRWASIGVAFWGMIFAALRYSYGYMPHYALFLETYIPLTMMFSRWGDAYSLDSRHITPESLPPDNSWRYTWHQKIVLLILILTFVSSGFIKLVGGQFLTNTNQMTNILLSQSVRTTIYGFPDNSVFVEPLLDMPFLLQNLRFAAIGFEFFFFMAIINKRWRYFFVALAFGFNWFNAVFLNIYFTQMILTYAIFVNWYQWRRILIPSMIGIVSMTIISALFVPLVELYQPVRIWTWYLLSPLVIYAGSMTFIKLIMSYIGSNKERISTIQENAQDGLTM